MSISFDVLLIDGFMRYQTKAVLFCRINPLLATGPLYYLLTNRRSKTLTVHLRKVVLAALVLVFLVPIDSQANSNQFIEIQIDSKIMGEIRTIIVSLPIGYENDHSKKYPVQYILDGRANIEHTRATSDF